MAELKSPNQKPPTIEKIREELDDGKFSSGAYHRPLVASQELPPTDKASQEQKK